ncbi:class I SAM-dependent methyltransferase [Bacillus benzoevorans]|uniref:Ubiquinone/menaquinone biosynthesis C-methylase UbiE n=1 Tax=Bacillus benzoevorans TaxID=1456 RepID=A0A7X0HU39_9BACI|nr:class I SAM-dependent methyltransferase [Bacillus benzoevorans]MBB6446821.1 ubiquinone/menaquinone biosynthesis C-methylase UbiE [Bacillus benzoevorans]
MINKLNLALRTGWFMLTNKQADNAKDYDKASNDYDSFFTKTMGKHSMNLINHLEIIPGQQVLELACGTGFFTVEMARRLNGKGEMTIVDQSKGMLDVARSKLTEFSHLQIRTVQSDMMAYLKDIPDESFDIVLCGWAICYTKPIAFLKEVRRILKTNGQIGIIETRSDSEEILMKAFEQVISQEPSYLQRYIRIELPKDKETLKRWFEKASLDVMETWDGEQQLPCHNADEAMEWVLRSGAAAGFIDVIDRNRETEILTQIKKWVENYAANEKEFKMSHTFAAGVARKTTM